MKFSYVKYFYDKLLNMSDYRSINAQKEYASGLYDAIIRKVDPAVLPKPPKNSSKELRNIYNKVCEMGYFNLPALETGNVSVSVIIPHYNHQEYLSDALNGLKNQTVRPDEIIIVDDMSNNGKDISEIINNYNELNIKLIVNKTKLYAGGCRQAGADIAQGDILIMHDADDISHPNRIEFTKSFFEMNPAAVHLTIGNFAFYGRFINYLNNFKKEDLTGSIITPAQIAQSMREVFIDQRFTVIKRGKFCQMGLYYPGAQFGAHAGAVAYRKEVREILKWNTPFNYSFSPYEDYEFNTFLMLLFGASYSVDLPLCYYRLHSTTNTFFYSKPE